MEGTLIKKKKKKKKKDSIKFFISMDKPLFLCFQEIGNSSGSNSKYPCRVSLKKTINISLKNKKKANNEISW